MIFILKATARVVLFPLAFLGVSLLRLVEYFIMAYDWPRDAWDILQGDNDESPKV
jgi:hypothetical protein